MTRRSIRQSISFRGVVRGCADLQWLITDAIWEANAGPTHDTPRRWIVSSGAVTPETEDAPDARRTFHAQSERVAACDLSTGWTATAPTANALAKKIRNAYGANMQPVRMPQRRRRAS